MMTEQKTTPARTETFSIENPSLNLVTVNSDVKIMESEDGRTVVEFFADSAEDRELAANSTLISEGSKITLEVGKKNRGLRDLFSLHGGGIEIVIRTPKTAVVNVKAVSADVEVESTLLNLDIVTVSGDVQILQNPTTHCTVKTVSGDVIAHTFSGCDYSLKSVSGDIAVHLAPGLEIEIDGKSISGDLTSEISFDADSDESFASAGSVTISASTVSGDFTLARN
jgi:DUF4097 and DUF4098 domain-containing protein YvlB